MPRQMPESAPDGVWADFRQRLISGDIQGALGDVATDRVPQFRQEFLDLSNADIVEILTPAGQITQVFVEANIAKYRYQRPYQGDQVTFLTGFVKENGQWKIDSL